MAKWTLRLLGDEQLSRRGHGSVEVSDVWWLIAAALVTAPGRRMGRGSLAGRIWPDKSEQAARHCLASTLWRIKLRYPEMGDLIRVEGDRVGLAVAAFDWVDVLIFEERAGPAIANPAGLQSPAQRRRLRAALGEYRGDFLGERDSEWAALERERLRALRLDALFALACAEADAGEWPAARTTAHRLCAVEPLREDAQRLLMRAHDRCGCRALAITQYRSLAALLKGELGIEPMPETQRLAEQLRLAQGHASDASTPDSVARDALFQMKQSLEASLQAVEAALAQ